MDFPECIVLCGQELAPFRCSKFAWKTDSISTIDKLQSVEAINDGAVVIIPGLYNSHTHMGDCFLPDGAIGMTLEDGFFRPDGYKYRQLATISREEHLKHIVAHLQYMARTGTVCHIDFREQGLYGVELLREASEISGVKSIILGQFAELPFLHTQLERNEASLSAEDLETLKRTLHKADGFSESTMNDLTGPAWRQIKKLTHSMEKLRAIHCLENEGYRELSMKISGRGDLERALELLDPHLVIHLTVANEDEIKLLADSSTTGVLNPRANAILGLPLPPVSSLMFAGINLLLGTDNGLLNSPNMFAELDFTYKLAKSQYRNPLHPKPVNILKMATSNVRLALGGVFYGYLDEGLPADFVVLDFNRPHLRASCNLIASVMTRVTPEDVLATVRQGRVIYQRPDFRL